MFTGEEDTTTEGAGTEGETSESDANEANTDSSEEGQDNSQKESDKSGAETAQKEDEEPPTRKPRTNADWVALRRGRKLERERTKHDEEQGEAEDEGDDDVSPEDAKIIEKVVARKLQPFEEEREAQTIRSEINEFVSQNPDFKEFVAKAEKWARHPSWKNVPTEQLMYAVAGKQLLTIGAKRREDADRKARETKVGGNSTSGTGAKKPVWDMTDAEFKAEVDKVKTGQTA